MSPVVSFVCTVSQISLRKQKKERKKLTSRALISLVLVLAFHRFNGLILTME